MWREELSDKLPLLGHRNWILIVDKAFPLQSAAGMTYFNSRENLDVVLPYVLEKLDSEAHVKPVIYTDKELEALRFVDSQGMQAYNMIQEALQGRKVNSILHDDVFAKIDAASKLFNVVVIKTESLVAYSSVFIELDCGYWSEAKEQKLRDILKQL